MGKIAEDISGNKYNNLTVICRGHTVKRYLKWECLCDCGNTTFTTSTDLISGHTKSCGKCEEKSITTCYNIIYKTYIRNAQVRNLIFDINFEDFIAISKLDCLYCGSPPLQILSKKGLRKSIVYNGLDRRDNAQGYTLENTVPCCKFCNFAKNVYSEEDFIGWINRLVKFRTSS